jgi:endonuclease YncB( thermonuclease family)
MSRTTFILALAGACFVIALSPAIADSIDTLAAADGKRYRLDGIDAPESDQVCLDTGGGRYRCGEAASAALAEFIAGRPVQCVDAGSDSQRTDSKHIDSNATERHVGQCFVDGTDLNHWLVENGWAINFEPYAKGRFKTDEETAKAGRLGMWAGCFVSPQDFRLWLKGAAVLRGEVCPADARERLFPDELTQPGGFQVKGHYALRAFPHKGIYHLQSCGSYGRTKAKRWFRTEADAVAAGFRKAYTCGWW